MPSVIWSGFPAACAMIPIMHGGTPPVDDHATNQARCERQDGSQE